MNEVNFLLNEKGVFNVMNGNMNRIANYMEISDIIKNIDSGDYKGVIKFKSLDSISAVRVDRDVYLNKNNLLKLQKNGLDITHSNVGMIVDYFRWQENKNQETIKNIHNNLGFSRYRGRDIYKLYRAIGVESTYEGSYEIRPQGSRDKYLEMLRKEVFGRCQLELALVCGLSAVTVGYIGEIIGMDCPIIHLVGNSSTGKSTALKLAISLFGYPDVKKAGLYGTYNTTNNALLKKLSGLVGVPYAIDEISMSNTENFTNLIYALANGADKDRLTKESEIMEKGTWLTTILSNGERSLINSSNKNAGIQVRVLEFKNIIWTDSAANAERINQSILESYGHLGLEFARYIIAQGREKVIEAFNVTKKELYTKISEELVKDDLLERRCSKYALLILTAKLFQEMLDISMDITGITKMLVNVESESMKDRNFKDSVIDYIKQYIDKHRSNFDGSINSVKTYGRIIQKANCVEVEMNKISFEEMLKQGGYEDKDIVLKELKSSGKLNCEKDRYTRSRKGQFGYMENVYVIVLEKNI